MKTIIITGSEGFVGSSICNKLKNNYKLVKLNRKKGYDFRKEIILDLNHKVDYFIHAAYDCFRTSKFSNYAYDSNIIGVKNALDFCKKKSAKFIFLSSYVYGPAKYLPIDLKHPTNPHNLYAKSKLECEKIILEFKKKHEIKVNILRLFNLYGYNQKRGSLIPDILSQIKNNNIIKINHFNSKRDFLFIDDFVEFLECLIKNNNLSYSIFNVGSGISTSILEILNLIKIYINRDINFQQIKPNHKEIIPDCYADISDLMKLFNWEPKTSIKEGIKKIINYNE